MAYNLHDVDNWKSFQVKHLFKGGLVIYIVLVYGRAVPEYQKPLWAILLVNVLQSCLRIKSMRMASKSNLLSKNVKPIVEYMKREDQLAGNEPLEPGKMEGYRYIVAGEHRPRNYVKRKRIKRASRSLFCSFAGDASRSLNGSFVVIEDPDFLTVDKIWRCKGSLLQPPSERGLRLRDVCLSMALCKMINRRVIEVELGFVYDLYYTRYPYLYRKVRYFALCLPVTMVILCSWLTYELFREHKDPSKGENAPLGTTVALMAVVTFLELVDTCNGLLYLCDNYSCGNRTGGDVTLVNPATRETLAVPPLSCARQFVRHHGEAKRWDKAYIFGYHPTSGRYKVVHVPCSFDRVCEFDTL
ncbi:hypothetical protein ACQ4PT_034570 [Festuca glaucescens]